MAAPTLQSSVAPAERPQPTLPVSRSPSSRVSLYESALVVSFVAIITAGAFLAFPGWVDDSVFSEFLRDGMDTREAHRDRPLTGLVYEMWRGSSISLPAAAAVHWFSWSLMALSAMAIWRQLLPEAKKVTIAVGCLVLAPVICQGQWVVVTWPMTAVLAPALSYVAVVMLVVNSFAKESSIAKAVAGCALVFASAQISEYAIPPAIFGAVVIVLRPWLLGPEPRSLRSRDVAVAVALLFSVSLSYAIFHQLADPNVHSRVRPANVLSKAGLWHVSVFLPRLFWQMWLVMAGNLCAALGAIRIQSYETLCAVLVGLGGSFACWRMTRLHRDSSYPREISKQMVRGYALVCAALLLSLVPMVVMGAIMQDRSSSRFLLPVLPVAACASVATFSLLFRPKFCWIIVVIAGFLLGYGQTAEFGSAYSDARKLDAWSTPLRDRLAADGLTVAVFVVPWAKSDFNRESFALTSRLTADWPADDRRRFWAFGSPSEGYTDNGHIDFLSAHPSLDFSIRGVGRKGPISRILWLYPEGDDLHIKESVFAIDAAPEPRQISNN